LELVAGMGEGKVLYRFFGWESWGKTLLRGPRLKFEDSITIDLEGVGCGNLDWNDLAQDRGR